MAKASRSNRSFAAEVMAEPGGEVLYRCLSCGTCASACLIRRVEPDFNPRRILRMVVFGMREEVLSSSVPWLCSACDICYQRCPQGIHISELMRAIRNIAIREGYEPPGPIAMVDEELCSGCGICVTACPYEAVQLATIPSSDEHRIAQVDKFLCMNCGICAADCLSESIVIEEFSGEEIAARMEAGGWFKGELGPKILLFLCDWCLRAETDLALLSQFPPNIRVINVPCSGSIDPLFVLSALSQGADGVLVVGCQLGECHYKEGNLFAARRVMALKSLLEAIGVDGHRLLLERTGISERGKLARTVEEFAQVIKQLGPNPLNEGGVNMGRVYDTVVAKDKSLHTLFDTGAIHNYITKRAAQRFVVRPIPKSFDVAIGGSTRKISEACFVNDCHIKGNYFHFLAEVLEEIGTDERGREIDLILGAVEMQTWNIRIDPREEKLDLSGFRREFVEY